MTVAFTQNIAEVTYLIKEDAQITENEIKLLKDSLNFSLGSLDWILHHHLDVHKHCAHWVPHQLTEEQRRDRREWFLHMLKKYDVGRSQQLLDIATGIETFV